MRKLSCILIYNYDQEELSDLLNNALSLLGFEPKYMDIFLSENEILSDIDYEVTSMLSLLDKGATGILIKNKLYDETDCNYWFRLSIDKAYYNKVSLQWLNSDLDFLISSNSFQNFLKFKNIICGYCYDQEDCFLQSNEDIEYYKLKMKHEPSKIKKNQFGDNIVDVSEHWGRIERVCGLEFMAAPLMWFGKYFFKIISKEDLLRFKYAVINQPESNDIVFIKLFELNSLPSENRIKQKEFWLFFELRQRITNYRKEHSIDLEKWVKEQILLKKQKKRIK